MGLAFNRYGICGTGNTKAPRIRRRAGLSNGVQRFQIIEAMSVQLVTLRGTAHLRRSNTFPVGKKKILCFSPGMIEPVPKIILPSLR